MDSISVPPGTWVSTTRGRVLLKAIVLAIVVVFAVILVRPCTILSCDSMRGDRSVSAMRNDLRSLVTAQEVHFDDRGSYAAHVDSLEVWTTRSGTILEIGDVTAGGWTGYAANASSSYRCAMFVGDAPPPRDDAVEYAPICWKDESADFRQRNYTIALGRSLESLVERQRAHREEHGVFATDPRRLNFYTRRDMVATIDEVSPTGWRASLTLLELALHCELEVTYPPGVDEPIVGEPRCTINPAAVGRAYATMLKRDLHYLDSLQRDYYAEHGYYAGTIDSITYMPRLEIVSGDAAGWHAIATHWESTVRCEIFVGTVTSILAGTVEGEPTCTGG